jgi:uncharacterized protein
MSLQIRIPKEKIVRFCFNHNIRKFALFGSVLGEDFQPKSDVDVLLEFEPGMRIGFFKLYDMEQELSQLLEGRRIEINTPDSISPYFRDEVLNKAEVQYVQT